MDLEADSTTGRDLVKAWADLSDNVDDTQLMDCWNEMVDYATEEVQAEYLIECPPLVLRWAKQTTLDFYTARRQGGMPQATAFDGSPVGPLPTATILRRNRTLLGRYGVVHVTVAG